MMDLLLQNYGFSKTQAKIYLACLKLWKVQASIVARRIKENRVTTYSALKELCKRNVAKEYMEKWIRFYEVVSPRTLYSIFEKKLEKFKWVLPELLWLANNFNDKPSMYFYEGFEEVKEIYRDTLKTTEEIYKIGWASNMDKRLLNFIRSEIKPKRIEKKIPIRVMYPRNKITSKFSLDKEKEYREILFVDNSLFWVYREFCMYWSSKIYMIISSNKNTIWVIIDNIALYSMFKSMFLLLWKQSLFLVWKN